MSEQGFVSSVLDLTGGGIAIAFLLGLVTILVLYVIDRCQTKQAIRHNYPIGSGVGVVYRRKFCDLCARVYVFSGVSSGAAM